MRDYIFHVPVMGYQVTHVLAESEDEAYEKFNNGQQALSETAIIDTWDKSNAILAEYRTNNEPNV
jgi:hypothetical protein